MEYRLSPASDHDRPWLESLRRSVYRDLYIATWGGWDEARHVRQFAKSWGDGDISIVEVMGERVGMLQLHDQGDRLEVAEMQIEPSRQGQGIGTRLLRDLLKRAQAGGKRVCLSVGLMNRGAVRLYERLGFHHVSQTETHFHMESGPVAERSGPRPLSGT